MRLGGGKRGGVMQISTCGTKLVKPPKDLTLITKANDGVFLFWRVFDIISGDKPVPGHDTFQMPI
jgi:hypothetical protein